MHSSRVESLGLKTARQKKEGAGGEMNSWLSRFLQAFLLKFGCCLQLREFMLGFMVGSTAPTNLAQIIPHIWAEPEEGDR